MQKNLDTPTTLLIKQQEAERKRNMLNRIQRENLKKEEENARKLHAIDQYNSVNNISYNEIKNREFAKNRERLMKKKDKEEDEKRNKNISKLSEQERDLLGKGKQKLSWIEHVKKYSKVHNMTYGLALSRARPSYYKKK